MNVLSEGRSSLETFAIGSFPSQFSLRLALLPSYTHPRLSATFLLLFELFTLCTISLVFVGLSSTQVDIVYLFDIAYFELAS